MAIFNTSFFSSDKLQPHLPLIVYTLFLIVSFLLAAFLQVYVLKGILFGFYNLELFALIPIVYCCLRMPTTVTTPTLFFLAILVSPMTSMPLIAILLFFLSIPSTCHILQLFFLIEDYSITLVVATKILVYYLLYLILMAVTQTHFPLYFAEFFKLLPEMLLIYLFTYIFHKVYSSLRRNVQELDLDSEPYKIL